MLGIGKEPEPIQLVTGLARATCLPGEPQPAQHMLAETRAELSTERRAGVRNLVRKALPSC